MSDLEFKQIQLLGVPIHLIEMQDFMDIISAAIQTNQQLLVPNYNLNAIRLIHKDETMKEFYKIADFRHIDGMPLVFLGKLLKLSIKTSHRLTYIDLAPNIFNLASNNGYKIFFLGSKPGVFEKAKEKLNKEYPKLMIKGHHGYFDVDKKSEENKKVIGKIKEFDPGILIVGMGMPRQEKWILANRKDISANVILTGGAVMDYTTGIVPTPPRILGKLGLEWLYRLSSEPKRLWKRYLVEPWVLLPHYLKDIYCRIFGLKQFNVLEDGETKPSNN